MAISSSGSVSFSQLTQELDIAQSNVNMRTMSTLLNKTTPDSISEFYGYNNVVTNGLGLYLDAGQDESYPNGGTAWTDLSGNGNNGTLINGPTYSSSNLGSIVFDGANDYVTLGTPLLLNQVQVPLTICIWAKASSLISNRTLWGVYKNGNNSQLYSLFRIDNGTLIYYASTSSGNFQLAVSSFNISTNIWNFYAVTVSGTISSPSVTIYLNNSSQTFSLSPMTSTPDASVDFRIGASQNNSNENWNGNISNVTWYNKALTSTEITQNFNAHRGRFGI